MSHTNKQIDLISDSSKKTATLTALRGILLSVLIFSTPAQAYVCTAIGGAQSQTINLSDKMDADKNKPGAIFTIQNKDLKPVEIQCPCSGNIATTYRSYITANPIESTVGNDTFVKINDYFSASFVIRDSAIGDVHAPIKYQKYDANSVSCIGFPAADQQTTIKFKILKSFINSATISGNIFTVYATTTPNDPLNTPIYYINFSGAINVPQSCKVNADQLVVMDFGNISSAAFKTAGAKADGVNPISRSIGIQCSNIQAQANLTLRLEANNTSGNFILSDNKDIGFVVTDASNRELTPNALSSYIPFMLDDNASANVTIKVYPVSMTGSTPVEGVITSLAYLRVDFA